MMVNWAAQAGLAVALLALAACGSIGNPLKAISGDIPPPDEFQVIAREPLRMPASSALPEPQPGAPSPLDPDPHRAAVNALMGASGAPAVTAAAPSAGERVLLNSANAAAASSDIRVQLEDEKIATEANKPYQPPSLGALFGGSEREKVDEAEMLDPVAESQRLQREGYRTPSDPEAVAATTESERPEPVTPTYPTGRPQSPIEVPGTAPAY